MMYMIKTEHCHHCAGNVLDILGVLATLIYFEEEILKHALVWCELVCVIVTQHDFHFFHQLEVGANHRKVGMGDGCRRHLVSPQLWSKIISKACRLCNLFLYLKPKDTHIPSKIILTWCVCCLIQMLLWWTEQEEHFVSFFFTAVFYILGRCCLVFLPQFSHL